MDRAEEASLKAYPVKKEWVGNQYGDYADINEDARRIFQEGYEQAEQDLALTWEDMHLAFKVINTAIDNCEGKTRQEVFQEAARLFNEQRQKK